MMWLGALLGLGVQLEPLDIPSDKCGVTVSAQEDDRIVVFAMGQDQQIYHKYKMPAGEAPTSDGFTYWSSMGGKFLGGPSVVRDGTSKLMVFARGVDKGIWMKQQVNGRPLAAPPGEPARNSTVPLRPQRIQNMPPPHELTLTRCGAPPSWQLEPNGQQWSTFSAFGGQLSSGPKAILNSEGFVHVFAKSWGDNTLMHKFQFAGENGTCWSDWASLGGALTSLPSPLLDCEGLLHVFVRGPDRALWHKRQLASYRSRQVVWDDWQCLGGVLASAPSIPAVMNGVCLVEAIVRASDKGFWHRGQIAGHSIGVKWRDWEPLGGIFASGPASVLNSDAMLEVFGRGADKGVWHKRQYTNVNGSVSWTRWTPLGGLVSTGPQVRMTRDGLLHLFVRGVDANIWYKSQLVVNDTVQFGQWKALGGNTRSFAC